MQRHKVELYRKDSSLVNKMAANWQRYCLYGFLALCLVNGMYLNIIQIACYFVKTSNAFFWLYVRREVRLMCQLIDQQA